MSYTNPDKIYCVIKIYPDESFGHIKNVWLFDESEQAEEKATQLQRNDEYTDVYMFEATHKMKPIIKGGVFNLEKIK